MYKNCVSLMCMKAVEVCTAHCVITRTYVSAHVYFVHMVFVLLSVGWLESKAMVFQILNLISAIAEGFYVQKLH